MPLSWISFSWILFSWIQFLDPILFDLILLDPIHCVHYGSSPCRETLSETHLVERAATTDRHDAVDNLLAITRYLSRRLIFLLDFFLF